MPKRCSFSSYDRKDKNMGCIGFGGSSSSYDKPKRKISTSIFGRVSSSSYDNKPIGYNDVVEIVNKAIKDNTSKSSKLPNPDPYNWRILESIQYGRFLVVKINYPDCKNYEGNKILLYDGVTLQQLRNQGTIDPHFSENKKFHSPIARFEPTVRGWVMAKYLASISEEVSGFIDNKRMK